MLTNDEQQRIRDTVRRSLDHILGSAEGAATATAAVELPNERLAEAERIIAEETERYYATRGLIRHESRSGRVHWVTPVEAERLQGRSTRRRSPFRLFRFRKFNAKVALVWALAVLVAVLLVAYLVQSATFANLAPS